MHLIFDFARNRLVRILAELSECESLCFSFSVYVLLCVKAVDHEARISANQLTPPLIASAIPVYSKEEVREATR